MKFTFLGTGTSMGVPVIACDCKTCISTDQKDKRLRSSLLYEREGVTFLFDAGPDFRQQMLRQNVRKLDSIFITHEHKDHIAGMDDVRAFNYISKDAIDIYAEERVQNAIRREYSYVFSRNNYPGIPRMRLNNIDGYPLKTRGINIIPIRVKHWNLDIYAFRIDDFAYITDASFIPEESMDKLFGVKYLVINALRQEKHVSHFNLEEALDVISILSPRQAYITHIGHQMGLHEKISKELPLGVYLAYDGLSVKVDG